MSYTLKKIDTELQARWRYYAHIKDMTMEEYITKALEEKIIKDKQVWNLTKKAEVI